LRGLARQHGLEMAYSFLDEAGLTRDSGFEHLETPEERVMVGV
jgi:hypothetical protein